LGIRGIAASRGGSAARITIRFAALTAVGLALAACSGSAPTGPRASGGHGGYRVGGPSYKVGPAYQINGVWYYPKVDYDYQETGIASWYGEAFDQKPTANGEIFDLNQLTAAHKTLPLPSVVEVTNQRTGRALRLRVNDRGPFVGDRVIDVSRRAAQLLGFESSGTAPVRVRILKDESIQVAEAAMRGSFGPAATQVAQAAPVAARTAAIAAPRPLPVAAPAPVVTPATIVVASPIRPDPADRGTIAAQPLPPLEPPRPVESRTAPAQILVAENAAASDRIVVPPRNSAPSASAQQSPVSSSSSGGTAQLLRHLSPVSSARAESYRPAAASLHALSAGRIYVQAGAFSQPENAQKARTRLASMGAVEVTNMRVKGVELYRVRVGPVHSTAEADRLVSRLSGTGYPDARVVTE